MIKLSITFFSLVLSGCVPTLHRSIEVVESERGQLELPIDVAKPIEVPTILALSEGGPIAIEDALLTYVGIVSDDGITFFREELGGAMRFRARTLQMDGELLDCRHGSNFGFIDVQVENLLNQWSGADRSFAARAFALEAVKTDLLSNDQWNDLRVIYGEFQSYHSERLSRVIADTFLRYPFLGISEKAELVRDIRQVLSLVHMQMLIETCRAETDAELESLEALSSTEEYFRLAIDRIITRLY